MRRTLAILLACLVGASLVPASVSAQEGPPSVPDTIRGYVVMPPGQDGFISADQFAAGSFGEHFDDQLEMYASLIEDEDKDVTEDELLTYFRPLQFSVGEVERTYSPRDGVTVYRDESGVPHIYADSIEDAAFASGYVTAEDRLFQMDAFRHAARGTLAGFVGPGENNSLLESDIATRREGYTEEEVQVMFDQLDDKYGETGLALQEGSQAYADGVNARMDEVRLDPSQFPFEYTGTGNLPPSTPEEWTALDTMFIAILQLRVFGETAGGELQNAAFYSHLTDRLGRKRGRAVYRELLFQNEPLSPTTIARKDADFSTQNLGDLKWKSVAIPDQAETIAEREASERAVRDDMLEDLGFRKPASNALLVSAAKSATGNPLLLGGPQVGHALPSFFLDMAVHAPGVDFRGPAVPGTSALIPLGRGSDYAWTLTTGYSDAVDVRVEKLCDPADPGGQAPASSNHYLFQGECVAMEERTETFEIKPPPTAPGPPSSEERTLYRTVHGPVFDRGTIKGSPVAFVKQRFFWMKEIDSLPSFYEWNTSVDSIDDFAAAAENFTMSFNSFYADSEDIGYFHVGEYPVRAQGVHPSLPVWGTGDWEWSEGRRDYNLQPKIVNPARGWVANWNNKPTRSWDNHDGFKWGAIQRVRLLMDRMGELFVGGGQAEVSDLVDVIRDAATRDARGAYLGPLLLKRATTPPQDAPETYGDALATLQSWIDAGAHRYNLDRDDAMDDGPALAIFDAWYDRLVHRIFDDEIGAEGYGLMADAPVTNYSPSDGGGFWFDFSSYLFDLVQKKHRERAFSRNYCDDTATKAFEGCKVQIAAALIDALAALVAEQGADMSAWTVPAENISFTENANSATAGSVDDIPWQNRGSENNIVEILDLAGT